MSDARGVLDQVARRVRRAAAARQARTVRAIADTVRRDFPDIEVDTSDGSVTLRGPGIGARVRGTSREGADPRALALLAMLERIRG